MALPQQVWVACFSESTEHGNNLHSRLLDLYLFLVRRLVSWKCWREIIFSLKVMTTFDFVVTPFRQAFSCCWTLQFSWEADSESALTKIWQCEWNSDCCTLTNGATYQIHERCWPANRMWQQCYNTIALTTVRSPLEDQNLLSQRMWKTDASS